MAWAERGILKEKNTLHTPCPYFPPYLKRNNKYIVTICVGATSWLNYAGINVNEFDSENSPLHMEGLPQGISLFLLVWITAYTVAGH